MPAKPLVFAVDLHKAGLDPHTAAGELGLSSRQVKRYLAGDCEVPKLVREKVRSLAAARTTKSTSKPAFRFIDLFAGIGGMRLDLRQSAESAYSPASGIAGPRKHTCTTFLTARSTFLRVIFARMAKTPR